MARFPEDMLGIPRSICKQNNLGVKPKYSDVRLALGISKPTVGKRIRRLIAAGHMLDAVRGNSKILELTMRARNLFP